MTDVRPVMNTIPSIFNARQINRTVLGGTEAPAKVTMGVSCVVIIRNGIQYRSRVYENVLRCGFAEVISVEQRCASGTADQISRQFPEIKCISALEPVTVGDMVNMGMAEATSPYVLVLQDDLCFDEISFSPALAKRLMSMDQYCIVPHLLSSTLQNIPVQFVPGAHKSVLEVTAQVNAPDGTPTLFPFDWVGFYSREKYIMLGGADYTVVSSYWQNMDLSFRAWLWGERITLAASFQLSYGSDVPGVDQTVDLSYLRFYLKNLLPVYRSDHALIPSSSFLAFKSRSQCGISESIRQFKDAQRWTQENKYRFRTDASTLIENWGKKE